VWKAGLLAVQMDSELVDWWAALMVVLKAVQMADS
jgi:hypothetical protein